MPEVQTNTTPEIPQPQPEIEPAQVEIAHELPSAAPDHGPIPAPVEMTAPVMPIPLAPIVPYEMQEQKAVENILSEGLDQVYKGLDAATQAKIKMTGEETAAQITVLLRETKVQIKKVLLLIIAWLKGFPGLNKHYVEQAAKIKADKLLLTKTFRS